MNSNAIAEECSSKQCIAYVDLDNGEKSILSFCAPNGIKLTGLWFTMEFDLTFQFFSWEYKFGCNYDNCNNATIVDHVITIFHEAYDLQSIGRVFGYKNNGEVTEQTTTATSTKSFVKSTTKSYINDNVTNIVDTTTVDTTTVDTTTVDTTTVDTTTVDTTTKMNHGLYHQSANTMIFVSMIIIIFRLIDMV